MISYALIEAEMERRSKSGFDMNKEFGYEIAHMKSQSRSMDDVLNTISFTLLGISILQNLYSFFNATAQNHSDSINILIALNIISFIVWLIFALYRTSEKEDDEKRAVCVEILEQLQKSKDF